MCWHWIYFLGSDRKNRSRSHSELLYEELQATDCTPLTSQQHKQLLVCAYLLGGKEIVLCAIWNHSPVADGMMDKTNYWQVSVLKLCNRYISCSFVVLWRSRCCGAFVACFVVKSQFQFFIQRLWHQFLNLKERLTTQLYVHEKNLFEDKCTVYSN